MALVFFILITVTSVYIFVANKRLHIQQSKDSLLKIPPNEDERLIVHDLFLSTLDPG